MLGAPSRRCLDRSACLQAGAYELSAVYKEIGRLRDKLICPPACTRGSEDGRDGAEIVGDSEQIVDLEAHDVFSPDRGDRSLSRRTFGRNDRELATPNDRSSRCCRSRSNSSNSRPVRADRAIRVG